MGLRLAIGGANFTVTSIGHKQFNSRSAWILQVLGRINRRRLVFPTGATRLVDNGCAASLHVIGQGPLRWMCSIKRSASNLDCWAPLHWRFKITHVNNKYLLLVVAVIVVVVVVGDEVEIGGVGDEVEPVESFAAGCNILPSPKTRSTTASGCGRSPGHDGSFSADDPKPAFEYSHLSNKRALGSRTGRSETG